MEGHCIYGSDSLYSPVNSERRVKIKQQLLHLYILWIRGVRHPGVKDEEYVVTVANTWYVHQTS